MLSQGEPIAKARCWWGSRCVKALVPWVQKGMLPCAYTWSVSVHLPLIWSLKIPHFFFLLLHWGVRVPIKNSKAFTGCTLIPSNRLSTLEDFRRGLKTPHWKRGARCWHSAVGSGCLFCGPGKNASMALWDMLQWPASHVFSVCIRLRVGTLSLSKLKRFW